MLAHLNWASRFFLPTSVHPENGFNLLKIGLLFSPGISEKNHWWSVTAELPRISPSPNSEATNLSIDLVICWSGWSLPFLKFIFFRASCSLWCCYSTRAIRKFILWNILLSRMQRTLKWTKTIKMQKLGAGWFRKLTENLYLLLFPLSHRNESKGFKEE